MWIPGGRGTRRRPTRAKPTTVLSRTAIRSDNPEGASDKPRRLLARPGGPPRWPKKEDEALTLYPGTLDEIDFWDLDMFTDGDPHLAWSLLRSDAPVWLHDRPGGEPFWCVTRYDDTRTVLGAAHLFSSERAGIVLQDKVALAAPRPGVGGAPMIHQDPPGHLPHRKIIRNSFTPPSIARLEDQLRRYTIDCLEEVADRREVDFVSEVAHRIPAAIALSLLGVPETRLGPNGRTRAHYRDRRNRPRVHRRARAHRRLGRRQHRDLHVLRRTGRAAKARARRRPHQPARARDGRGRIAVARRRGGRCRAPAGRRTRHHQGGRVGRGNDALDREPRAAPSPSG